LGYVPLTYAIRTLNSIATSLAALERYRGHLFNWYATDTMQVLRPRYISFVDSGNFVAFLVAAQEAIRGFQFDTLLNDTHFAHLERWIVAEEELLKNIQGDMSTTVVDFRLALSRRFEGFDGLVDVLEKTASLNEALTAFLESN